MFYSYLTYLKTQKGNAMTNKQNLIQELKTYNNGVYGLVQDRSYLSLTIPQLKWGIELAKSGSVFQESVIKRYFTDPEMKPYLDNKIAIASA